MKILSRIRRSISSDIASHVDRGIKIQTVSAKTTVVNSQNIVSNEIEGRLEVKFGHEQNLIHNLAHGSQADLFLLIINRATNVVVTERRFAFKEGGFVLVNN